MTAKTLKTAEEEEIKEILAVSGVSKREVHKYLAKITNSQKRARRTQIEINRLKKRTDAVLAKLT